MSLCTCEQQTSAGAVISCVTSNSQVIRRNNYMHTCCSALCHSRHVLVRGQRSADCSWMCVTRMYMYKVRTIHTSPVCYIWQQHPATVLRWYDEMTCKFAVRCIITGKRFVHVYIIYCVWCLCVNNMVHVCFYPVFLASCVADGVYRSPAWSAFVRHYMWD